MKKVKKTTVFYWISGIVILLVIGIIAFLFAYILERSVTIKSDSIVLWFVGFLTAFIVIGNYAQVKSIEQDFSQKVGELKHEFSEKDKKLETEFDKKVFMNQNFQEIKEIYKEMSDSISLVAKLLSEPSEKRKGLSEEGNKHLNGYSTLLKINKFVLPKDLFIIFEEVEDLLADCFNNNIYIPSTPDNNKEAEQRIFDKINSGSIKINELKNRIDDLLKLKYAIN